MGEHEPKTGMPEIVFMIIVFLILEVVDFIPIIGPVVSFCVVQLYIFLRGLRWEYQLAANIVEFLLSPIGLGEVLPVRTIGYIITVWLDHHPKATATAAKAVSSTAVTARRAPSKVAIQEGTAAAGGTATQTASAQETPGEAPTVKNAGPAPAEEIFAPAAGPIEKLQAELSETRPLPEGGPVTLDEENNTVDLRRTA